MTKLIIQDGEEKKEIDYSELSEEHIEQRIKQYEEKYDMSYQEFYNGFDCDDASMDELTDLLDWESLVEEKKVRIEKAVYERT